MRPLATYRGEFAPFPGALLEGARSPEGAIRQSEGALMLAGRPEVARELADALGGVSRQLVSAWQRGERHPTDEHQKAMEGKLGIPAGAWSKWRPTSTGPAAAPTPTEERSGSPPAPPDSAQLPAPDGSSVVDRARALLAYLAVPGRKKAELDQAKEIRAALSLEARLMGLMANKPRLDQHPDWPPFLDALVRELAPVPGALDALERVCATPEGESAL